MSAPSSTMTIIEKFCNIYEGISSDVFKVMMDCLREYSSEVYINFFTYISILVSPSSANMMQYVDMKEMLIIIQRTQTKVYLSKIDLYLANTFVTHNKLGELSVAFGICFNLLYFNNFAMYTEFISNFNLGVPKIDVVVTEKTQVTKKDKPHPSIDQLKFLRRKMCGYARRAHYIGGRDKIMDVFDFNEGIISKLVRYPIVCIYDHGYVDKIQIDGDVVYSNNVTDNHALIDLYPHLIDVIKSRDYVKSDLSRHIVYSSISSKTDTSKDFCFVITDDNRELFVAAIDEKIRQLSE